MGMAGQQLGLQDGRRPAHPGIPHLDEAGGVHGQREAAIRPELHAVPGVAARKDADQLPGAGVPDARGAVTAGRRQVAPVGA